MKALRRVLQYFRPDTAQIVFALGLLGLSTSASLLKPWPLALIVDSVLGGKPLPPAMRWAIGWSRPALLVLLAAAMVVLYAGQGALAAWQNYVSIRIGLRGLVRVRNAAFDWLEHLSLRFHQGRTQGDLIYRLSWDTYAFQTLFQQGIFTFLGASLSLVLMLAVMWLLNPLLALLALLIVPLLILSMKFLGRGMSRRSLAAHQADSQVTSSIQQTMAALPLIQSYTGEQVEADRFATRVREAYQKRVAQHGWEVLYSLVLAAGFGVTAAGLAWLGAREVLASRLTIGEMLVFLGYLTQLYEPLNQLSHVGATVSDATAGTQRVLELFDAPREVSDSPTPRPVIAVEEGKPQEYGPRVGGGASQSPRPLIVHGNVSFEQVCFAYEEGRPVLKDVSFRIDAGESVALLGPSGAGKTTLLQLLPRFYDPNSGAVRLEGADLRELRLKDLRAQVALVPQEPVLLLASVAENIAYGRPSASQDEIERAAKAAHADIFIQRMPQGYATVVGEGAARLSVGEKQRLNLARAFLKDAPILVLDEPTSALDAETEALVVESLDRLMARRTVLLVAHRLSTVRRVDRVVVLESGRIVEMGAPEHLLQTNGYYARVRRGELPSA
jgi:ATP-binding cassette subfamily B protein/subfamily B ATP-binding cassette protein MsbA